MIRVGVCIELCFGKLAIPMNTKTRRIDSRAVLEVDSKITHRVVTSNNSAGLAEYVN